MAVSRDLVHVGPGGGVAAGRGPRGSVRFWPYTQSWRHVRRQTGEALVDPVTAVVDAPAGTVLESLVADEWEAEPKEGGIHVLWGERLPRRMTAHAALGPAEERDHVRLWGLGGVTVLAAHHEVRADNGGHRVTSWEIARERVASALENAGATRSPDSAVLTLPEVRSLSWDGRIWRFDSPKGVRVR